MAPVDQAMAPIDRAMAPIDRAIVPIEQAMAPIIRAMASVQAKGLKQASPVARPRSGRRPGLTRPRVPSPNGAQHSSFQSLIVVGLAGFEPATSSSRYENRDILPPDAMLRLSSNVFGRGHHGVPTSPKCHPRFDSRKIKRLFPFIPGNFENLFPVFPASYRLTDPSLSKKMKTAKSGGTLYTHPYPSSAPLK
jgi:hypothetical protein